MVAKCLLYPCPKGVLHLHLQPNVSYNDATGVILLTNAKYIIKLHEDLCCCTPLCSLKRSLPLDEWLFCRHCFQV